MPTFIVALGSNMDDPARQVLVAAGHLNSEFTNCRISPLYASAPMYLERQPSFINAAAVATTALSPRALLRRFKAIESVMGRESGPRNGPRLIDLDLIAYGNLHLRQQIAPEEFLEIPHPRIFERLFVVQPVADLAVEGITSLQNLDPVILKLQDDGQSLTKISS